MIAFPSVFEEYGGKLVQDNVVRITGRVNARDKSGNIVPDVKVLMDTCEAISDDVLANYQETGTALPPPAEAKGFGRRKTQTTAEYVSTKKSKEAPSYIEPKRTVVAPPTDTRKERVYVLVKEPNNVDLLSEIKRVCDRNLGMQDIILVLQDGEEKKALKMPFRVDASDAFISDIKTVVGEDCVKIK